MGLDTFVDPRWGGGKINACTTEDLVRLMEIDGKEYLFYKAFPISVGIIRATTADPDGNLTMEREALTLEALAIAMAARNSGGIVIAQVERIAERGTLHPRHGARCPACWSTPWWWPPTRRTTCKPSPSSTTRPTPVKSACRWISLAAMPLCERKVIARRAALELRPNSVVNLGIGMPEGVASVAAEERIIDLVTLTAEPGVIGGIPASGMSFGAAVNAQAVIDQPNQFDFYDGGGLDIAVLGLAQADAQGNLNVSKFGPRLAGAGGFINISQNAKTVVFVGTFTAGDLDVRVEAGRLQIRQRRQHRASSCRRWSTAPSAAREACGAASACCTSPSAACSSCSRRRRKAALELIEIAPGIDLERDILAHMDFMPAISPQLAPDGRGAVRRRAAMGLRERLLATPLAQRFELDREHRLLFINFEGLAIDSRQRHRRHRAAPGPPCWRPWWRGERVAVVVNYDNLQHPAAAD